MKKTLTIEGMSCQHCVMHTKKALEGLAGVKEAQVDLNKKTAVVEAERDIPDDEFKNAVDDAGYQVTGIS